MAGLAAFALIVQRGAALGAAAGLARFDERGAVTDSVSHGEPFDGSIKANHHFADSAPICKPG
jgi:hypothetical protein